MVFSYKECLEVKFIPTVAVTIASIFALFFLTVELDSYETWITQILANIAFGSMALLRIYTPFPIALKLIRSK